MKKRLFFTTFALATFLLFACTNSSKTPSESVKGTDSVETPQPVTTDIPFDRDFQQINNFTDIDIEWSEGPCSVTFVGTPFQLADYDIDVDDAGLTINLIGNAGDCSLIITSPTLTLLSNYGDGSIRLRGTLHTDKLEIGNMQNGLIEADTLECQSLKYTSQETANAQFSLVRANDAFILADGSGNTDLHLDVRHLNLQAWGSQTITLTGHADKQEINCSPTNTVNNQLH